MSSLNQAALTDLTFLIGVIAIAFVFPRWWLRLLAAFFLAYVLSFRQTVDQAPATPISVPMDLYYRAAAGWLIAEFLVVARRFVRLPRN